jgi:hypothetical protein
MRRACLYFLTLCFASTVHAETVMLPAAKDNTIYADNVAASNGKGEHLFAGTNLVGFARRGLVTFDIGAALPAGATVDSVVLELNMSRTAMLTGPQPIGLHRVLANWGEGESNAAGNEGGGTAAQIGDATWAYAFYDTVSWTNAGGDFAATASALRLVNDVGFYAWRSTEMRDDVQAWLDDPATNFGWILIGNEGGPQTSKRFDSLQNLVAAVRPKLTVHYTAPPTAIGDRAPALDRLLPAAPNPFHDATAIRFELGAARRAALSVYDARGRRVHVITQGWLARGGHDARWDGKDAAGHTVAAGVYFVRLESQGRTLDAQRIVRLR